MTDLFRLTVSEYARHPENGRLHAGATHVATVTNNGCGDRVELRLTVADSVVIQASYDARGCAICSAASALLSEYVLGHRSQALESLAQQVLVALQRSPRDPWPTHLEAFAVFGVLRANPARRRCAGLAFEALTRALERGNR